MCRMLMSHAGMLMLHAEGGMFMSHAGMLMLHAEGGMLMGHAGMLMLHARCGMLMCHAMLSLLPLSPLSPLPPRDDAQQARKKRTLTSHPEEQHPEFERRHPWMNAPRLRCSERASVYDTPRARRL